ncbi:MAG TPA: TIGR03620 family F420-dependent LLM class oxidoreductase [Acidimicrobiales bacterium]
MAALTGTGIWSAELRFGEPGAVAEAAAELESWGYTAVWIPDARGDLFGALDRLRAATSTLTVASGILNIWRQTADATNAWWAGLSPAERDRTLIGLGVSHGPLIGDEWRRPLTAMGAFLDDLDVPADRRCLAALGPRMLALARDRSAGAHPYLVTPEHTARAREVLGPEALLAPEQGVVLETGPAAARGIAREAIAGYTNLPNYVNNWKRLGYTDDDVSGLSDRLVDALVAWGDVDAIAARVAEHRAAGADHVCLQVLLAPGGPLPRGAWKALAGI